MPHVRDRCSRSSSACCHDLCEEGLYRKLLLKAGGDHDLVTRLINYEARQTPTAGRAEWLQRAIVHWESDLNRW